MQGFFKRYQKAILWAVVIIFVVSIGFVGLQTAGVFQSRSSSGDGGIEVLATVDDFAIDQRAFAQAWVNTYGYYQNLYQQVGQDLNARFQGAGGRLFALQLQNEALESVIRQAILDAQAAERGIVAPRAEVNAQYEQQYAQYLQYYTEDDLRAYASGLGMSLQQFQQSMRDGIAAAMRNEELQERLTADREITEEELEVYWETNITRYDQPEQVQASHILVEDRALAEDLRQQLITGADFAALAEAHSIDTGSASQGGFLDWFGRGQMVPEFEEAAFSLDIGAISHIVETQFGFHILTVSDRREARTPTLDEIRDQVLEDATEEMKQDVYTAWYDAVYAATEIDVKLPLLAAFREQVEGVDEGIAAYEGLVAEGYAEDPYLHYYLGRLYEQKLTTAVQQRTTLEDLEESVRVEQILVSRRRRAEDVLDALEEGEAFADLAAEYSIDEETAENGGDLGFVVSGELPQELEDAVFGFEIGSTPVVVETDDGFHVVRVTERTEGPTEEELARIEELQAEVDAYRVKAREAYAEAMAQLVADDRSLDAAFLERVRALDPENVDALYYLAIAEAEAGNTTGAMSLLREVRNTDPEYFDAYVLLADLAASVGIYMEAIDNYTEALALRPDSVSVMTRLAETHLEAGHLAEAEALLVDLQELDPGSVRLKQALGDLAYERLVVAVEERDGLLELPDPSEEQLARIAVLDAEIESLYASTVEHYEDALLTSTSTALTVRLGRAHLGYGALDLAEREFDAAVRQSPYEATAYEGLAEVHLARGEMAEAIENLGRAFLYAYEEDIKQELGERLVELAPEDLEVRLQLAQVYARRYMWSAAIRQYAYVIERRREDAQLYELIAEAYRWRTEYDMALDYLQRGLEQEISDSERIILLEKVIEIDRSAVGARNPLSAHGLDARLELAALYIDRIELEAAVEQIDLVEADDPEYRQDKVAELRDAIETLITPSEILELDELGLPADLPEETLDGEDDATDEPTGDGS
ncbi:MAG: peptidylprolyl isomerase [Candidatus Bipolaricaulota bacterium]|nr:MAG: peptidylprolyl isomerase [Candidatus Bipolaricaulota bacterium]